MENTKLSDIAKALNVSSATVSRSLNNHPLIKEETKKAVRDMAIKMGYQSNRIAAALRTGDSKIIGIMVPDLTDELVSAFLKVIEQELRDIGLHSMIVQSLGTVKGERAAIKHLLKLQIDGLIVLPVSGRSNLRLHRDLKKQGIKEVYINEVPVIPNTNSLLPDYVTAGQFAARHLIDQGCSSLAFIGGHLNLIKGCQSECDLDEITFRSFNSLSNWQSQLDQFEGVVCENDQLAFEISVFLQRRRINIPSKVAVISCGNSKLCELAPVPISSIDFQYDLLASQAVQQMLIALNSRRKVPSTVQYIPPRLIVRKSSQKAVIGWKLKMD